MVVIAIPGLILEVAIENAYRAGPVVAYNAINKRLQVTGLGLIFIGFVVLMYFNVVVIWVMGFFERSFTNPLPWVDRNSEEYFMQGILRVVDPVEGSRTIITPVPHWSASWLDDVRPSGSACGFGKL